MIDELRIFPWHKRIYEMLVKRHQDGNLPHALLFGGVIGGGKFQLASNLIHHILAIDTNNAEVLDLLLAGTHPDMILLRPFEGKKTISIDQVREASEKLVLTPQISKRKIALIQLAEQMTVAAANALLKTLEEPAGDSLLILISHSPGQLPQTIRSRCQLISIPSPSTTEVRGWLNQDIQLEDEEILMELVNQSPCRAKQYLEDNRLADFKRLQSDLSDIFASQLDIVAVSASWEAYEFDILFSWLSRLVHGLIQQCMIERSGMTSSANLVKNLKISPNTINLKKLLNFYAVLQTLRLEVTNVNLNRELLLEQLFLNWTSLKSI